MDARARRAARRRGLAKAGPRFLDDRNRRGAAAISDPDPDPATAGAFPVLDDDDPVASLRREEALRRAREVELSEQRRRAEAAEAQLATIRQTLSYGLGHAIVDARTFRGLLRLPARIVALRRRQRAKRASGAPAEIEDVGGAMSFVAAARARAAADGIAAARGWLRRKPGDRVGKARALVELALDQLAADPGAATALGEEAIAANPREPRLWALADALYAAGAVAGPSRLLARLTAPFPTESYRRLATMIERDARLLADPGGAQVTPVRPANAAGTVAVVTPRGAPFHEDGAAFRAEEIACAITRAGREVLVVTPPGYPVARTQSLRLTQADPAAATVRLPLAAPGQAGLFDAYRGALADAGAAMVHLVADDRNVDRAVAAAAASLGLPLVLDIGALDRWAVADPAGERARAAIADLVALAAGACRIVARSPRSAEILRAHGVEARLLPLAPPPIVAPDRRMIADLLEELAIGEEVRMIGCLGRLDPDPGLEALIDAVPSGAVLVIAGAGAGRPALERRVVGRGTADRVRFVGPLLPGDLVPFVAACELVVFPRESEAAVAADEGAVEAIAVALGVPIAATAIEAGWRGGAVEVEIVDPAGWPDMLRRRDRAWPQPAAGAAMADFYATI